MSKMTLKEALQAMMDFDPEKHDIFYHGKQYINQSVKYIKPISLMQCFYEIRPKPQTKTRPMNWSELRELVVKGAWFKRSNGDSLFKFTIIYEDCFQCLIGKYGIDSIHYCFVSYSLDGCKTFLPLTVTETK